MERRTHEVWQFSLNMVRIVIPSGCKETPSAAKARLLHAEIALKN
jgi:hypothetical protein